MPFLRRGEAGGRRRRRKDQGRGRWGGRLEHQRGKDEGIEDVEDEEAEDENTDDEDVDDEKIKLEFKIMVYLLKNEQGLQIIIEL